MSPNSFCNFTNLIVRTRKLLTCVLCVGLCLAAVGCALSPQKSDQGTQTNTESALVSLDIAPKATSLAIRGNQQLTAIGHFKDGSQRNLTASVHWTSSAPHIVHIDARGIAIGLDAGASTISASLGHISGESKLKVQINPLTSLAIAPARISLATGDVQQLRVVGKYLDGSVKDVTASAAWSSSTPTVASISASGVARATSPGTTLAIARIDFLASVASLTVTSGSASLQSISVTPVLPVLAVGGTQQFSATGTYSDGSTRDLTRVASWSCSAPAVASINQNGFANALTVGTARIAASLDAFSSSASLTIDAATLQSISVNPPNPSIVAGSTQQFSAIASYSDGSTRDITSQGTWTTSPAQVATITNTGLATATGEGTATIQVSFHSVAGTGTMAVMANSTGAIASTFFSMHVNDFRTPWPTVPIGGVRLWDTQTTWGQINTSPGIYDWTKLDRRLTQAQSRGADVMYELGRTPVWAQCSSTDSTCGSGVTITCGHNGVTAAGGPGQCYPPNDLKIDGSGPNQHWKDWVTAVVTHSRGFVRYYEIWNEPDIAHSWQGSFAQLARMEQDAKAIVGSIDPSALVVTPAPVDMHPGPTWMDRYMAAGGAQAADVIAFHGYVECIGGCVPHVYPTAEDEVLLISKFKAVMLAHGQQTKPIFITEGSWGRTDINLFTDQDLRSAFIVRYHLLQGSLGIARSYWYLWDGIGVGTLWDTVNTNLQGCAGGGIPNNGGYLCPSGIAYQQVYNWLVGASPSAPCSANGTVWSCGYTRGGGYHALAVWDASKTCSNGVCATSIYSPDSQFVQYRDLAGGTKSVASGSTIQIGAKPVLLETGNVP